MKKRHLEIVELVTRAGEVSIRDLMLQFKISGMTARRDLDLLSREGSVIRTFGGAMPARAAVINFEFSEKGRRCINEKRSIAGELAGRIKPGMSVVLDTGTTTLEVARILCRMKNLRILTSSLAIAAMLYMNEDIELVLLGGVVRKGNPDLAGPLAEDNLRQFHVNMAILGADAIMPHGIFTDDDNVARVCRAMIRSADEAWVAVDHSKFDARAFHKYADWTNITGLVTDSDVPAAARHWLAKTKAKIVFASTPRLKGGNTKTDYIDDGRSASTAENTATEAHRTPEKNRVRSC